ncbi:MAG TPA: sensor histidine kinase, partial [Candidatus Polarisedimenticolaceae bacterium]|nr:sensor histidine kinase [Candidatus Polarisedimenticolaceae bacterium]
VPALMTSVSVHAIQRAAGQPSSLFELAARQVFYYSLFASACPLLYRLGVRQRFSGGRWPRAAAAHAGTAAAVVTAVSLLGAAFEVGAGRFDGTLLQAVEREFTTAQGQLNGLVNLFNYVLASGAMTIIRLTRERREHERRYAELDVRAARLEAQVARARLRALEMQINPHFLFNALNGIASLIQQRRGDDAFRAIALLGELLRETIGGEGRKLVPLEREAAFLERYLELERMRFGERMRSSIEVAVECRAVAVPVMILQPLVENAVRHAVAERRGPGAIRVTATARDGRVVLEVRDDGPGLRAGWSLERDAGIGLQNVRHRLDALFGDRASLTLESLEPHGVVSRIVLPGDR